MTDEGRLVALDGVRLMVRTADGHRDPVLHRIGTMLADDGARDDLHEFCDGGFAWSKLRILLRRMGAEDVVDLVVDGEGETYRNGAAAYADFALSGGLSWRNGKSHARTWIAGPGRLPATALRGMAGRRLAELVRHPLLPPATIAELRAGRDGAGWEATLSLPGEAEVAP